jgi:hypothetical protein
MDPVLSRLRDLITAIGLGVIWALTASGRDAAL